MVVVNDEHNELLREFVMALADVAEGDPNAMEEREEEVYRIFAQRFRDAGDRHGD